MTILPLAVAVCFIWFANFVWIIREIMQHTPNWTDSEISQEEILQNFLANTPPDRLQFVQQLGEVNPFIGVLGLSLLCFAFIL